MYHENTEVHEDKSLFLNVKQEDVLKYKMGYTKSDDRKVSLDVHSQTDNDKKVQEDKK